MKFELHPLSALTGAAVLGLALLASSALQTQFSPAYAIPHIQIHGPVQVAGIPTPRQMVRVTTGTPFTVPQDRIFVATGVYQRQVGSFAANICFDAQLVLRLGTGNAISSGLTAPEGTVVTIEGASGETGVLLGYLVGA